MFKLKAPDGSNNLCGKKIKALREAQNPRLSQRKLAQKLQVMGYDVDNHFVRRIENGERYLTDIELALLARVFEVPIEELFKNP